MEFPEITIEQVFQRIPKGEIEAVSEREWNNALHSLGNCQISSQGNLGAGRYDALVRYFDSNHDKYAWILVEYKRDGNGDRIFQSICQLLMYLGNIFYDTSIEGTDNFAGLITAGSDYFYFIPREEVCEFMAKFEPVWKRNFRVRPFEAYKNMDIALFVSDHIRELYSKAVRVNSRYFSKNVRLDEIIKSIYKEWNLQ